MTTTVTRVAVATCRHTIKSWLGGDAYHCEQCLTHLRAVHTGVTIHYEPAAAAPPADVPVSAPIKERTQIHCEDCRHEVNATRAPVCASLGHVVSVVEIRVTTFNAPSARPFTAAPAPYLGSTR